MTNTIEVQEPQAGTPTPQSPAAAPQPGSTVEQWSARGVHTVHLPSGMVVKMRLPDLAYLLAHGRVPENLKAIALAEVVNPDEPVALQRKEDGSPMIDEEAVRDFYDLRQFLVTETVVEPALTVDDLPFLPSEDIDMLQAIATRQTNRDARGVILGVEPISRWETFRREHGCAPGCEACEEALGQLSTVDVAAV